MDKRTKIILAVAATLIVGSAVLVIYSNDKKVRRINATQVTRETASEIIARVALEK